MTKKKNLRRLNTLVTAQTMGNLERLAFMAGYRSTGQVIDKLTRDRMVALRFNSTSDPEDSKSAKVEENINQ